MGWRLAVPSLSIECMYVLGVESVVLVKSDHYS